MFERPVEVSSATGSLRKTVDESVLRNRGPGGILRLQCVDLVDCTLVKGSELCLVFLVLLFTFKWMPETQEVVLD